MLRMAKSTPLIKFIRKLQNFQYLTNIVDIFRLSELSCMKSKTNSRRNSTRTKMADSVFKKSIRIASVVALYW